MHNSQSDSVPPLSADDADTNDIDSILSERSITVGDILAPGNTAKTAIRNDGCVDRMQLRVTHIATNLKDAAISICELQDALDKDRHAAGLFVAEMHNWNRVMDQLERCVRRWPAPQVAEIPAAPNTDKSISIAATVGQSGPGEQEFDELLTALQAQENKIHALETRLQLLQQTPRPNDAPASDPYVNRLIVVSSRDENLKFPLTDNIVTIGRDPSNAIQLRTRHVSRYHARIVNDRDSSYIEDLDSSNGVMVNSTRVRRQKLHSGDIIDLGRMQLKFIDLMDGTKGEGQA